MEPWKVAVLVAFVNVAVRAVGVTLVWAGLAVVLGLQWPPLGGIVLTAVGLGLALGKDAFRVEMRGDS